MTVLPVMQAISRKLFGNDLAGSSVWVQHGTLWVGFLGALLATARGKHLGLSTVEMLPERLLRLVARVFGAMVTAAVVALLAYAAMKLVQGRPRAAGHAGRRDPRVVERADHAGRSVR